MANIEKVYGSTTKQPIVRLLVEQLDLTDLTGTLYIGYPILASAEEAITLDALLITNEHGLVAFIFVEKKEGDTLNQFWEHVRDSQDKLIFALEASLKRHPALRQRRDLGVKINVVSILPDEIAPEPGYEDVFAVVPDKVNGVLKQFEPVAEPFVRPLNAALQRVTTIKPAKKRASVVRNGSRGSILKEVEKQIANLDRWQKQAAIESPEGPQRIRGLAGSGKTIVLALKAAYLHAQHPDWDIALTFHSRALYQQFKDLVRRFSFEHLGDEPNWEKLRIMHTWGGSSRRGIYTEIAAHCGLPIRDFLYAKTKFGFEKAFDGICEELLAATSNSSAEPIYDAVLIDEAQDLPWQFFRLVFRFTRAPKRIAWAYDELQHLSESAMPPLEQLFGADQDGQSNISLENSENLPRRDIILPVCYRNTPWALSLAHALGFGIYREAGLVQHFDDPLYWTEIGYRIVNGNLEAGDKVTLERDPNSYPEYFAELLKPDDAVTSHVFGSELEQAEWIAEQIKTNLTVDELEMSDILVILPIALTAQTEAVRIIDALARRKIRSHLVGVTTSQDEVFSNDSVALVNIYRAKGNEAPMVYLMNSQACFKSYELIKIRNILFTAITRCRGWVRLCGYGSAMEALKKEIGAVQKHDFRLSFQIPTPAELAKLRRIHRDRTAGERTKIKRVEKNLADSLKAIQSGEVQLELLPPKLRDELLRRLNDARQFGDDE